MKKIDNYIQEKLYINKDYDAHGDHNIVKDLLRIINPSAGVIDGLTNHLKKWIEEENIVDFELYVHLNDYKKIAKKCKMIYGDTSKIVGVYKDMWSNDPNAPDLKDAYSLTRKNWHYIRTIAGVGYYDVWFDYRSNAIYHMYIKGIKK